MADTTTRTYTVPLRRGFSKTPRYKRTNKAVTTLRAFLVRHMKVPASDVRIGQHLNLFLWNRGIRNPPARVKITVEKTKEGIVRAEIEGKKYADVAKPQEASQEPQGLKEKLASALGGKDEQPDEKA